MNITFKNSFVQRRRVLACYDADTYVLSKRMIDMRQNGIKFGIIVNMTITRGVKNVG